MKLKRIFFDLTPLGKADIELKDHLDKDLDTEEYRKYEKSRKRYRDLKILHKFFKILLYASIVTAVATTFGFDQVKLVQQIASYLGTTLILIFYGITQYFALVAKESYHVHREILISEETGS